MQPKILRIESKVPMPISKREGYIVHVLRKMLVGDSVVIPTKTRTAWHNAARLHDMKVATRATGPTESRVWRVA